MRFSKIALALGLAAATAVTAQATQAATFTADYRHEYRSDQGQNFDRICLIGAFENGVGFYVDSSFKSGSNNSNSDPDYSEGQWGDFTTNATEMSLWWGYKIQDTGFTITPGIITESTNSTTGYKPYLRLQYNTSFGLWFAIRPRYDYWRYDNELADQKNARIDAWIGYSHGNFGINYNYTHMWDLNDNADGSNRVMYDNKDWNYEQNLSMNYRIGKWNPYIEFGDLSVGNNTDKRQLRLRVGIQYTF